MSKLYLILVLLLLVLPLSASAYTLVNLQEVVASLLVQVQQLQEKLAKMQSKSTSSWCYNFNTDIGFGNTSDEVYPLYLALQKEGINYGKFDFYDEIAVSAVSSFQEKYRNEILTRAGLAYPTGYLGARTREKLNLLYGCSGSDKDIANPILPSIPVACTMEAKLCSDGVTYVSRVAPTCEFSKCPDVSEDVVGSVETDSLKESE